MRARAGRVWLCGGPLLAPELIEQIDEENLAGDIDRTNNEIFFALNLFIDDDGDGIPRAWEIANGLSDSNAADANGDPDHDGFTNRQEYLAGTNPHDGNSYLKVGQFNVIQNANGTTAISTISWVPVVGRLYVVERSFDLVTWQVVTDNIEATPPGGGHGDAAERKGLLSRGGEVNRADADPAVADLWPLGAIERTLVEGDF